MRRALRRMLRHGASAGEGVWKARKYSVRTRNKMVRLANESAENPATSNSIAASASCFSACLNTRMLRPCVVNKNVVVLSPPVTMH